MSGGAVSAGHTKGRKTRLAIADFVSEALMSERLATHKSALALEVADNIIKHFCLDAVEAAQTAGLWQVDECEDANGFSTIRPADDTANGDIDQQPIATVYEAEHASLIAAACNGYHRHFGPRAIEAAEADLLGKALEALKMAAPLLAEAQEALCGRDDVCVTSDGDDALLPLRDAINFILSQAREAQA